MSGSREIKQLQRAKTKAQNGNNIGEEAIICNKLGELLSRQGDYKAAVEEHQQELALSVALSDVIGRAVANRKIGECFAEMGDIEAALKHQRCHLDLARSVRDHAEMQRALATIGRTFLFRYESDHSRSSLMEAGDAFKKSLAIVDERLEGTVPGRELSEMRARLFLNLGLVCDHLGEPKRCSDFIRRSVFIAEKNQLLEDLYRANFNLGHICFKNSQHSSAVRCLEQAKECAKKMKDKFGESECFHSIGKVQLSLGDFAAARRSLKKALLLGSQLPVDRQAVKKAFRHADRGCQLEEEAGEDLGKTPSSHDAVGLAEQLGDLYCKVGSYAKALEAYRTQLSAAEALGKPSRELAVIHVSLAATYTDLRQHSMAVEHYRRELALRQGNPAEECSTWLNMAVSQEESGSGLEDVEPCYRTALQCAKRAGLPRLQKRVLRMWLAAQQRGGSAGAEDTEAELRELDIALSDSDDDLEGYDKTVSGRRKTGRWNKRNEKGETSLHRACIEGNHKQVQYLLEQGHPANPRDYCGWTPLHEACNHGHRDVVCLLLERGANVNDPGGPLCEGVTPLHDSLACGHFDVARLLVERGASVTLRNAKGEAPLDTLRHWQRTYSRELDRDARQECTVTEKLLRRALAGGVAAAPAPSKPFEALQDSQLFDAECSEPLLPAAADAVPCGPTRTQEEACGSARRQSINGSVGRCRTRTRGREAALLYGNDTTAPGGSAVKDAHTLEPSRALSEPGRETVADPAVSNVFAREEYHSVIRGLGSAKSLHQGAAGGAGPSQPQFTSTPALPSDGRSALVPEDEYLADDWLEDDLEVLQPKKKRRVGGEQGRLTGEGGAWPTSAARSQHAASRGVRGLSSVRRTGATKPRQAKMTQMSGLVRLGRREVSRSQSPSFTDEEEQQRSVTPPLARPSPNTHAHAHFLQVPSQAMATAMPPPIRMRVRVQDDVFLIPVPQSEADVCTVAWLCDQAAHRYYQKCGLLPRLSLQKEGALLSPQDLLLAVLHTNEEVLAEVCSWDLPPLPERYKKACQKESKRVSRLCETQDGGPSVTLGGLGLAPDALAPLLRALKLQASLTELRLSGNRLRDDLLPELVATAFTMPRLRVLDVSSNGVTGEGLEKVAGALRGKTGPAFPCLEELDLSMNPLGDSVSDSLSCLLSHCPLLARLSLRVCCLTARFLQQHRLLLASALSGTGHLKSVCLSHNALGSTGFELVLKTLPFHCLTHLDLSAVCSGLADNLALEHLAKVLSQEDCSCLPVCPHLTSLNLSGNPSVTSTGLHSILASLKEAGRSLTLLNLQGCQVSGPWDSAGLEGLAEQVADLRLCSQSLNKLDREALRQSRGGSRPPGLRRLYDRGSKFLLASGQPSV
ncbi:hypothetical protein NHX12_019791 [Muraenolepis orangiensis]|uniref:Tonsoku-like protein n=1 Tax=Muraenolepis orangiensis TaxID=630683 RepID=A0A9Q0EU78_9TELE|nr:hypothetical protein NHX12_019791 [Muraenolepis orangiensis]